MLESIREMSKGWVAAVFIGLLVMSFAIWGITDVFRMGGTTPVATIGNVEISQQALVTEFQRRLRAFSQRGGFELTSEQARVLGFDQQVLRELVQEAAVTQKLEDVGLLVGDEQIRRDIFALPAFQGITGTFDRGKFLSILNGQNLSEDAFIALMRRDIAARTFTEAALGDLKPPAGLADALTAYANERRTVDYFVLTAANVPAIPVPNDEALTSFIQAHPAAFTAPERRSATIVLIAPEELAKGITVGAEELQATYDARRSTYVTPETRVVEQIRFPGESEAAAARAKIDAGTSFIDIAREAGFTEQDIALGDVSAGDPTLPADAFTLAVGEVSKPLEGPFGWVLLRVVSVTPGTSRSFEDVRAELAKELALSRAVDEAYDLSDRLEDGLASGQTLTEAAAALGLQPVTVSNIDATGKTPDGTMVPRIEGEPEIVAAVFAAEAGQETDLATTETRTQYMLRVEGVVPAALRPLDEVRDDAIAAYAATQRNLALRKLANDLAASANKGTLLSLLAANMNTEVQTSGAFSRDRAPDGFAPTSATSLFALAPAQAIAVPGADPDTAIVARLADISQASGEEAAAPADIADRLAGAIARDLTAAIGTAAEDDVGVEINPQAVERALGTGS
ncbi:MAG: hypothetical protein GC199_09495 [Alphaproteobacteria bacterium]|nr:hypothetical protein [Alphaproteobacteria bacterium]